MAGWSVGFDTANGEQKAAANRNKFKSDNERFFGLNSHIISADSNKI